MYASSGSTNYFGTRSSYRTASSASTASTLSNYSSSRERPLNVGMVDTYAHTRPSYSYSYNQPHSRSSSVVMRSTTYSDWIRNVNDQRDDEPPPRNDYSAIRAKATSCLPRVSTTSAVPRRVNGVFDDLYINGNSYSHPHQERYSIDKIYSKPRVDNDRGRVGLRNIGNTCFMNSIIQCLSNSPKLRDYILNREYVDDLRRCPTKNGKSGLMAAFADLLHNIWSPSVGKTPALNTESFKSQVQRVAPRFVGFAQQDAQEFLRYLLRGLHDEVNRSEPKSKKSKPVSDNEQLTTQEAWKRYLQIDNSVIVDLFVGQLRSELRCFTCNHVSTTFDPFWDLSLPVAGGSLSDCLEAFTRAETLDGDEKPMCEKCKRRRRCSKEFSLERLPHILVLHLKRFSTNDRFASRLSTMVRFPLTLDLRSFTRSNSSGTRYNLYAVSNHMGSASSGHYTAFCRQGDDQWCLFDDSNVSSVDSSRLCSSDAYVLFYEKIPS